MTTLTQAGLHKYQSRPRLALDCQLLQMLQEECMAWVRVKRVKREHSTILPSSKKFLYLKKYLECNTVTSFGTSHNNTHYLKNLPYKMKKA